MGVKYPASKKITRDMLALSCAQVISGYVKDGAIIPALSPVKVAAFPHGANFACYLPQIKRYVV